MDWVGWHPMGTARGRGGGVATDEAGQDRVSFRDTVKKKDVTASGDHRLVGNSETRSDKDTVNQTTNLARTMSCSGIDQYDPSSGALALRG